MLGARLNVGVNPAGGCLKRPGLGAKLHAEHRIVAQLRPQTAAGVVGARHALRAVTKQRPLRACPRDQVPHVQADADDPGSVEWNLLHGGVGLGGAGPRLQTPAGRITQGGGAAGRLGQSQCELLDRAVGTLDLAANLLGHQPPVGQPRGQALRQGLQRERQAVNVVLFPLKVDRFA